MAQTAQDWLVSFAAEVGTAPPTQEDLDLLRELAGVAAHASERPAAPITCCLAARAGVEPRDALAAGRRPAREVDAGGG